ncbi:MAG: V-type ATP synthase subunit E family protein [Methanomassiliicoccales archaeon]
MALERVVEKILENARKDADQLIAAGEKERGVILAQANEAITRRRAESEKSIEESVKRLRQQELSSAELEAKRVVLNTKKEVLDRTFEETMKELARLSQSEKARIYSKILENGIKVVSKPTVYCPRGESPLVSSLPGVGSVIEMDMGPGLVLESRDGLVRLDFQFDTILESIWEKELKNVSGILFG